MKTVSNVMIWEELWINESTHKLVIIRNRVQKKA